MAKHEESGFSPSSVVRYDARLRAAVDALLREHHEMDKPRPRLKRKDSFSTITTSESDQDPRKFRCRIRKDHRCNEFVPLEVVISSWTQTRPAVTKPPKLGRSDSFSTISSSDSRKFLCTIKKDEKSDDFVPLEISFRSQSTVPLDDDIVFLPPDEKVERLSFLFPKKYDSPRVERRKHTHYMQCLSRKPSKGLSSLAAPPIRKGIHELSIRRKTRKET